MTSPPSASQSPSHPAGVRFSPHLNESDAILWHIERDPALRTTVIAIAVLDRAPDLERLRARLLQVTGLVPRLRQRVVETPLHLGPPRWVDDDRFDLDYHLRRVSAPAPGDLRAVLDLAGPIAMAAFDRARPLWEFTIVEGMADGGAALIQKLHHSFVDGVGGVALARMLLDESPDAPSPLSVVTPSPAGGSGDHATGPHGFGIAVRTLSEQARGLAGVSWRLGRSIPRLSLSAVEHPQRAATSVGRTLRSVGRLLAPADQPLSPVMRERSLGRRLEAFDLPLERLRAAADAADGTLNDAFLAAVTGGMRRYHERHGEVPERLRVTMPINRRHGDDELGNNRFTPARFALPIATVDPVARMHELGEIARRWRAEPALPLTEVIAGALNRLPTGATTSIFGAMLKAIDFVATNVPGIPERTYLAGAEVVREFAFAPPSGSACSIALLSHHDRCCIGITIDTAAVPDSEVLGECIRAGFDEVTAAGRQAADTYAKGATRWTA